MSIKSVKEEFKNMRLLPMFEIEVKDKKTGDGEYIVFDIFIQKNSFIMQHEPLNTKEVKSKFIPIKRLAIDPYFSLDHNLQQLYDIAYHAILESEFFFIPE